MTASELEKLNRERATIKSKLTRFNNFINDPQNHTKKNEISSRLEIAKTIINAFESVESKIENLSTADYVSQIAAFETDFYKAISCAKALIETPNQSMADSVDNSRANSTNAVPVNSYLPRIELPVFKGAYDEWVPFYDKFKSIINDDPSLSDVQKLCHLRSSLKDEAAETIDSLDTISSNYKIALDLLKERFENKRIIIQNHIKILFDLPSVPRESAAELRTLLNKVQSHVRALKNLGQNTDEWDMLLIHLVVSKLDRGTHREWEKTLKSSKLPDFQKLLDFLKEKCNVLEFTSVENRNAAQGSNSNANHNVNQKRRVALNTTSASCLVCSKSHKTYSCEEFSKLPVEKRIEIAKNARACFNCLNVGHRNNECRSSECKKCSKKHHTMLHLESKNKPSVNMNSLTESPNGGDLQPKVDSSEVQGKSIHMQVSLSNQVLLGTAIVDIEGKDGLKRRARVLLDGGAMSCFMTKEFADSLKLKSNDIDTPVSSLERIETRIKKSVTANVYSRLENYKETVEFLIVKSVCDVVPMRFVHKANIEIPNCITLADPDFNVPSGIDALIGAEIFYEILNPGKLKINNHRALLQSTRFGWVVAGRLNGMPNAKGAASKCFVSLETINNNITKFWEMQELPEKKFLSDEDQFVEEHYKKNTIRKEDGTYVVKLPFNNLKPRLGETLKIAEKRLYSLEKRFRSNPDLKKQYVETLRDYIAKGHMIETFPDEIKDKGYFIPHQAVLKPSSATTKCRVVLDASCPSSTGFSLNNVLHKGANLQPNIFDMIISFRSFEIVATADVEKMYLQVHVHEDDTFYQLMLWRENEEDELKIFRFIKIVFGQAPSSYLAGRTLLQLAEDECDKFPRAAKIVQNNFYVDNAIIGAHSLQEAISLRDELNGLLTRGGFRLRQWVCNDPRVIKSLPENLKADVKSNSFKTLGVEWDVETDELVYDFSKPIPDITTKRDILADITSINFDPPGVSSPVSISFKIKMQEVWTSGIGWDDKVPDKILNDYIKSRQKLNKLGKLRIPRKVIILLVYKIQLHGFSDASEKAYGACIYVVSCNKSGEATSRLLCAKTRVAPLKTVTLARLELCAAILLANLLKAATDALELKIEKIFQWTDSAIVLQWINTKPYKLKTFVANRVAEIQNLTVISNWRYVPTNDNPADIASRGTDPDEFFHNRLWLKGPEWLIRDQRFWPENKFEIVPLIEVKGPIVLKVTCNTSHDFKFLKKFSSINKIRKIMIYVIRFINNAQKKKQKRRGNFSVQEREEAFEKIIFIIQNETYSEDMKNLQKEKAVRSSSELRALSPYLDNKNLIRVGGRLRNARVLEEKFPIVLPKHHITNLLIEIEHIKNYHAGVNATLNAVRSRFWPIHGRSQVKRILRQCVKCSRTKPVEIKYLMGNLPETRLTLTRPFQNAGVDYCGPFLIKEKKIRNRNQIKVYIAIFVCFATKACHIEVVSDLTSEAFIACLRRFFARRGRSTDLFSDNGTNFVGANREIQELKDFLASDQHNDIVKNHLLNENVTWHFSPPRSPHFGGLWESAVKSFKRHLLRSVDPSVFTFEEFNTLATEIEAILNSRPLTQMSTDPNDLRALTPGHFLIGEQFNSLPDPDLTTMKQNTLSRWQHVQQVKQHLWKRWQQEYLHELNARKKWQQQGPNIKVGSLVTMKEDNLPPLQWVLGRVTEIHPGADGAVRVVTVRTKNGTYVRGVKSIAPLPIEEE